MANLRSIVITAHAIDGSGEFVRAANMAKAINTYFPDIEVVILNGGKDYSHLVGSALEGINVVSLTPVIRGEATDYFSVQEEMFHHMNTIISESHGAENVLLISDYWPLANGTELNGNHLLDPIMEPFVREMSDQGVTLWASSRAIMEADSLPNRSNAADILQEYDQLIVFTPESIMHIADSATAHDGEAYLKNSDIAIEHLGFLLPELPMRHKDIAVGEGNVVVVAGGSYTPQAEVIFSEVLKAVNEPGVPEILKNKQWDVYSPIPPESNAGQRLTQLAEQVTLQLAKEGYSGNVVVHRLSPELKQKMANADMLIGQAGGNIAIEATALAARQGLKVLFTPMELQGSAREGIVRAEALAKRDENGCALAEMIYEEQLSNHALLAEKLAQAMQLEASEAQKKLFLTDAARNFVELIEKHFITKNTDEVWLNETTKLDQSLNGHQANLPAKRSDR